MKTNFTFSKQILRNLIIIPALMLLTIFQLVAQSKHIVGVTQNVFTPNELDIVVGDTVEWRNTDGYHNVNGTTDIYPSNPESFGNDPGTGWTYSHVFTITGEYDYQCDPHVGLGMVGKIVVKEAGDNGEKHMLTINFTGMNPHIGQNLHLAVIEKNSGMEISRLDTIAEAEFTVQIEGIESGMSYNVDFYADHNSNGMYDAPPTDHAWRLELDDVMGDTTLNFAHNTNFTDIMWQNRLTVHFTGMNPHVGQDLWLAVSDKTTGMEVGRVKTTAEVDFMVHVYGIENGMSYNVDFYADQNSNGMYDAPPIDHAWRLDLDDVMGDTTLNFAHNTNFSDIMWQNRLTVHFTGMNPHVGQDLWLAVSDKTTGMEVGRVKTTAEVDFMVHVYGIENGMSYNVDFYADHNSNGMYDAPPTDHAWRLDLDDVMGDTTLNFAHNTNFTDIMWQNRLTLHFTGMNPHVGQYFWVGLVDQESGTLTDSIETTASVDFMVHLYGIENGMSYNVDFFADHNSNGMYDAPPTDHAWRLELENVMGDTTLTFAHNTNFTDIFGTTSISEKGINKLKMYPNPATDIVSIELNEQNLRDFTLLVYNIAGKLNHIEPIHSNNKIEFSVLHLNRGVYFVELKSNSLRETMKLIKK